MQARKRRAKMTFSLNNEANYDNGPDLRRHALRFLSSRSCRSPRCTFFGGGHVSHRAGECRAHCRVRHRHHRRPRIVRQPGRALPDGAGKFTPAFERIVREDRARRRKPTWVIVTRGPQGRHATCFAGPWETSPRLHRNDWQQAQGFCPFIRAPREKMELRQRSSRSVPCAGGPRHWRASHPKKNCHQHYGRSSSPSAAAPTNLSHKAVNQVSATPASVGVRGGPFACRRHTLRRRLQPDGDDRKRCFPTAKETFLEHLIQVTRPLAPLGVTRVVLGASAEEIRTIAKLDTSLVVVNPRWEQGPTVVHLRGDPQP